VSPGPNLAALLGPAAKGLSAKTITRLKADWWTAYQAWEKRDLGTRRFLVRPITRTDRVHGLTLGRRRRLQATNG
jgi:hypothetical protein